MKVNYIVLDTGCSNTLVHHDLVLQEKLLPGKDAVHMGTMYSTRLQMSTWWWMEFH